MKKEKVYILQKKTTSCNTGMEFHWIDLIGKYQSAFMNKFDKPSYFEAYEVENNVEWFKEKEEPKPTIANIRTINNDVLFDISHNGIYTNTIRISKERLAEILIEEHLKTNK